MTERLALDHLVYAVPDLSAAIAELAECLGLTPAFGGRHEGLGTHNAILPLEAERYLELIAIDPDSEVTGRKHPFGLGTLTKPRLVAWAVRSREIKSDIALARKNGFDPGVVSSMARRSPTGAMLHWKLTVQATRFGDGLLPFVIDWGSTPHPSTSRAIHEDESRPEVERGILTTFSASHPDPEPVRVALEALGARLEVSKEPTARLRAEISGPKGRLELG